MDVIFGLDFGDYMVEVNDIFIDFVFSYIKNFLVCFVGMLIVELGEVILVYKNL